MPNSKAFVMVLDSAEPEKLADFYSRLLSAEVQVGADLAHLTIVGAQGIQLVIRRHEGMVPPVWPQSGASQEVRMRLLVDETALDETEREIISLGGQPLDIVDGEGLHDARTFADPDGHPFALLPG